MKVKCPRVLQAVSQLVSSWREPPSSSLQSAISHPGDIHGTQKSSKEGTLPVPLGLSNSGLWEVFIHKDDNS